MRRRRNLALILITIMLVNIVPLNKNMMLDIRGASTDFLWNKNDTMDTGLKVVPNKAGDDDILLEGDVGAVGGYDLVYYLEDSRRTTVHFDQQFDKLKISYRVDQLININVPADPDDDTISSITKSLADTSFLEMDYSAAVPDWKYISDKSVVGGNLEYTILKNASSKYPGVAFEIAGKRVIIKWDFATNTLYYLIVGYNKGNILNATYTRPTGQPITINILKALEKFEVRPTHIVPGVGVNVGVNVETSPIPIPGTVTAGSRPGLEITFQQPKELDTTDWVYKTSLSNLKDLKAFIGFQDIASDDYLDFNFNLKDNEGTQVTTNQIINELPKKTTINKDVGYVYNPATGQYKIEIVQDKSSTSNLLNFPTEFIEWDELAASKIYDVNVDIQVDIAGLSKYSDYEFDTYAPSTRFAYTYMAYTLNRANMTEAYLDIVPYDVGSDDELEYTILYSKTIKAALDPNNDLWVRHYFSNQSSAENIFIPIPFRRDSSQDVYQVLINFAGTKLTSQVLNYRAIDDLNVPPTTPKIESIDNLYVVPPVNESDPNPSKAQFDLTFSAPDNRNTMELDTIFEDANNIPTDDRIYYELLVNDMPTDTAANPFKVIKVFEVYKDNTPITGGYKIRKYVNTPALPGSEQASTAINFPDGYNSIDDLFRMDKIDIFTAGSWANVLNTVVDKTATLPAAQYSVTDSGQPYDFEFPGVNYIRVRALTLIDNKIGPSYLSIPVSLSLSLLKYDVPIPDGLSYSPLSTGTSQTDKVGVTVDWQPIDVVPYEEHMLSPTDKHVDANGIDYGVYFSTDQDALINLDPEKASGGTYFAPSNILMDPVPTKQVTITPATLKDLRSGKVFYFDLKTAKILKTKISADIIGLDQNTNYYMRIVTKLNVSDVLLNANPHVRMSKPSALLSTTTPVITIPPNEGDMKPLSVVNFQADFLDETLIGAKLSWDFPKEITFAEDMYGFEVISIEDRSLPDAVSADTVLLEDLIDHATVSTDHVEMWKVLVINSVAVLLKYEQVNNIWGWIQQPANQIKVNGNNIEIIDGSNTPNKVYYYYARTINVVGDNDKVNSASSWQKDTLTTAPVKGPINLAVTYDALYAYNPKTESNIRFDAPIPLTANLATDYVMEIFVKGEDDDDYSSTKYPATLLTKKTDGEVGYTRLYYHLTGLKPGKAYSIKVRIEDRTKPMDELPDGTQVYPRSAFSDRIVVRTEFDQSEYDKEIQYQKYLDYFDLKVKDYSQGSYFILEKTTTKNVVKYRDSFGLGDLQINANGTYPLYVENVKTNIIYLPADFVEAMNANKVVFKIILGGNSLNIRPYSVGKGITKAINDQVTEIQKYGTTAVDYYLKMTIDNGTYNGLIHSKTPASALLDIKMEVVGSNQIENNLDEQMIKELNTVIAWKRSLLRGELSAELNNGIDDKKLLNITQTALDVVKSNFKFSSNLVLINKLQTVTKPITAIAKNMSLNMTPITSSTSLQALKKVGTSWQLQATTYIPDTYSLETMDLTSYVLIPQEVTATSFGGTYSTEEVGVINKYQLVDIFNSSELSTGSGSLQKYRMVPAFARMLGAPTGSNDVQYLKDKGIAISTVNMYTELKRGEVLYLHTLVFAKKNALTLSNAKILNYNMIQDLSKVVEAYRNTLLIGANMNIYKLTNGQVLPDNKVTIKEFIELLTKIDKGLNW